MKKTTPCPSLVSLFSVYSIPGHMYDVIEFMWYIYSSLLGKHLQERCVSTVVLGIAMKIIAPWALMIWFGSESTGNSTHNGKDFYLSFLYRMDKMDAP